MKKIGFYKIFLIIFSVSVIFFWRLPWDLTYAIQIPGLPFYEAGEIIYSNETIYTNDKVVTAKNIQGNNTNAIAVGVYAENTTVNLVRFYNTEKGSILAEAEIGNNTMYNHLFWSKASGVYIRRSVNEFLNAGIISAHDTVGNVIAGGEWGTSIGSYAFGVEFGYYSW